MDDLRRLPRYLWNARRTVNFKLFGTTACWSLPVYRMSLVSSAVLIVTPYLDDLAKVI